VTRDCPSDGYEVPGALVIEKTNTLSNWPLDRLLRAGHIYFGCHCIKFTPSLPDFV